MAVLIFVRHDANIRRLLKGEEPRIGGQAPKRRLSDADAPRPQNSLDWLRLARTEIRRPGDVRPSDRPLWHAGGGAGAPCPILPGAAAATRSAHP